MLSIRNMRKDDVETLYNIALRSFQRDYEKYGVYPPLINQKRKRFLPPLIFGKTILSEDVIIGGAFVIGFLKKGELGAIFLDTCWQGKGYGRQAIQKIEKMYSKVKIWKLETPAESYGLHCFYESLGYIKIGEKEDAGSGVRCFVYEKKIV